MVYGLSTATHLMGILAWWLLCQALQIDLSLVTVGWVRSAVILATMVPLSVMGLGLREGAVVFLLTRYGIGQDTALAYSVLSNAALKEATGFAMPNLEDSLALYMQRRETI